mgnify:CR=1 FL=1
MWFKATRNLLIMNSYVFNAKARFHLIRAITRFFDIPYTDIYKKVKSMKGDRIIIDTGEVYEITLKKIS